MPNILLEVDIDYIKYIWKCRFYVFLSSIILSIMTSISNLHVRLYKEVFKNLYFTLSK